VDCNSIQAHVWPPMTRRRKAGYGHGLPARTCGCLTSWRSRSACKVPSVSARLGTSPAIWSLGTCMCSASVKSTYGCQDVKPVKILDEKQVFVKRCCKGMSSSAQVVIHVKKICLKTRAPAPYRCQGTLRRSRVSKHRQYHPFF
jgi:hypothetical protein